MDLRVHITNIYGFASISTALKAQNRSAKVAKENLNYNELGIYIYDVASDSPEMLRSQCRRHHCVCE